MVSFRVRVKFWFGGKVMSGQGYGWDRFSVRVRVRVRVRFMVMVRSALCLGSIL